MNLKKALPNLGNDIQNFLNCYSLFLKVVELQALNKQYDNKGDKMISYEDFIKDLREPLNERRQKIVDKAFQKLDQQDSGKIDMDIIN